jgi:hypothetical protein
MHPSMQDVRWPTQFTLVSGVLSNGASSDKVRTSPRGSDRVAPRRRPCDRSRGLSLLGTATVPPPHFSANGPHPRSATGELTDNRSGRSLAPPVGTNAISSQTEISRTSPKSLARAVSPCRHSVPRLIPIMQPRGFGEGGHSFPGAGVLQSVRIRASEVAADGASRTGGGSMRVWRRPVRPA